MAACDYVDLGFAEETEAWRLQSHLLPSKLGGKPAWLSLKPLPGSEEIKCGKCGEPCVFLLQLYSPIESDSSAFHRTIFVFICRNPSCHKDSKPNDAIIVFRSSLPRVNPFYSSEPPNYDANDQTTKHASAADYNKLCTVCGCVGDKKCSQCHTTYYCSKEHQVHHWKAGHKAVCKTAGDTVTTSKLLFPEYGFKMEEEDEDDSESDSDDDTHKKEIKAICNKGCIEKSDNKNDDDYGGDGVDDDDEDGGGNGGGKKEWKEIVERLGTDCSMQELQRMHFNSIIPYFLKHKPVVKYARGGILSINEDGNLVVYAKENYQSNENHKDKVESRIPKCENCGSERAFEFVILPHLLSILGCKDLRDGVGWVAVFTCKNNCSSAPCGKNESDKNQENSYNYSKEFAWTQFM